MTPDSAADTRNVVTLASLPDGAAARLVSVEGGQGLRSRLTAMGLRAGSEVRVVRNGGHGPFVVASGHARIVLGRGMAHRVVVTPLDGPGGSDADAAAGAGAAP
ncbi:MAG: ferrous iron transport protein A [Planctomycetes bacterium]|nr:ferrous iron transport protein A [Planctomycetota bacterium]